jgi:hypothetical protein
LSAAAQQQEPAAEAVEVLKRVPGALQIRSRSSSKKNQQAAAEAVQNNSAVCVIEKSK